MKRLMRHVRRDPSRIPALLWQNLRYPFTVAAAERRFDRSLGIETAGDIQANELGLGPDANGYHAMPPKIAECMIEQIMPRSKNFTFVDLGAGKGRVLLIASRWPFRKVIGVELFEPFCELARRNVRNAASRLNCIAPIEIIHADASSYVIPDGPCVFFLYNPFFGKVADGVVANILRSFETAPRDIIVLYYSDKLPARLGAPPFVKHEFPAQPRDCLDRYSAFGLRATMFELMP